jgi:hypothetical protein
MPLPSPDCGTLSPLSFVDPSTRTSVRLTNPFVSLPSLVQSLSLLLILSSVLQCIHPLSVTTWPAATVYHSHNMVSHEMIV